MDRVPRKRKTASKLRSKSVTLARPPLRLFGEPLLLEGEERAAYDELLARFREAVKPADIVDEMYIADAVELEWELLRWRRFEFALIRARQHKALKSFVAQNLEYHLYEDYFTDDLGKVLQEYRGVLPDYLQEGENNVSTETLVDGYVQNEPGVVFKVNFILKEMSVDPGNIEDGARARKAEELVQDYRERKPTVIELIDELLARNGVSMDSLAADRLASDFAYIERIDRLIAIAENRRNAFLREIERRRTVLGQSLRRTLQEIEEGEFKVIETTPKKGTNAA
jgi:hypothetical protein